MKRADPKQLNKFKNKKQEELVHLYFGTFQIAKKNLDPAQPPNQVGVMSRVFHLAMPILDTQQVRNLEQMLIDSAGLSGCVCMNMQPLGSYPKAMFDFTMPGQADPPADPPAPPEGQQGETPNA